MPPQKREELRVVHSDVWEVVATKPTRARRGVTPEAGDAVDPFLAQITKSGRLTAVDVKTLRSQPRRGVPSTLDLEMEAEPDALYLVMARHESGAIVFVRPSELELRRSTRATSRTIRFTIPVPEQIEEELPEGQARRSVVGKLVKAAVLKVVGKLAEKSMPLLAKGCETAVWKLKKLQEGWKSVSPASLQAHSLPGIKISSAVSEDPARRNLLFIHGTFSYAASGFSALATTRGSGGKTFFESLQPIYGDRIFAFDHFTVSRAPEENARALLAELPKGPCLFDVVTHSRGGLVLRTLVENAGALGPNASRFQLGRAVLVASPNGGTPLASPNRFQDLLNWLSNLIDYFPDNPFTTAAGFITEGLAWLAHAVQVDIPGLAAMNSQGQVIQQLQLPPGPPPRTYSALAANFEPDHNLLQRMLDVGVDLVFRTANDLVVPTEGGWLVDPGAAPVIPGDQIGCFGRDGNVANPPDGPVNHVTFFSRTATVDFLVESLQGKAHPIPALDPATHLRYLLRRGAGIAAATSALPAPQQKPAAAPVPAPMPLAPPAPEAGAVAQATLMGTGGDEVFYISVLGSDEGYREHHHAEVLATFRNARAMGLMQTRRGKAGQRFQNIIQVQRDMHDYLNGEPGAKGLPDEKGLITLGTDLFETLFEGRVRRLYDAARTAQPNGRLHLIFTSMISWIADLPWEFAYDPERKNFLATSEVNFTRNVDTAIPADRIGAHDKLRILVVVAQPLGLAHLSVDEETAAVKSGFQSLIKANLADVNVLLDATPALLHQMLEVAVKPYDVIHFIGHGEFDDKTGLGYLVFENENEGVRTVDSQVLQQILCRRGIRLMFLNACETGKGGSANFIRGVAPALVAAGVPAVVANQFSVLDVTATDFASHFYWALAQGQTIGDAAREARVAVNYSISGEAIDWAVPVVFARNPGDRLASRNEAALEQLVTVQRSRAAASRFQRRALTPSGKNRSIVGLWDVHHALPHLDQIADRLSGVQGEYIFKPVSFVAPLGTWQREKSKDVAYLNAEKVASRLKQKPKELGLDRLIAFTNFPLRDDQTVGLYAWDDSPRQKISIFSTYDLLDQVSRPLSIERMVANAVAAFLADVLPHKTGRQDCVSSYNAERDIRFIAGPLEICPVCRKKLQKISKGNLDVIEKLLKAYP
jgi:CHAT domain-containing protein